MTPRETVLEQIRHRETARVPYTFAFEPQVAARLDTHFGSDDWRRKAIPYVGRCGSVAGLGREQLDETRFRDAFGTVWRTDQLPPAVVDPGLKQPTFDGYDFPSVDRFLDPAMQTAARERLTQLSESFTILSLPFCLWQSWYLRGFENTMMDCIVEESFYADLLDRLTALCLAMVQACSDIPADAIMMGDDWGDQRGVMVGPDRWRRFYKPRYARIFQAIHAQGKLAIMHCCGSVADIMPDITEIGLDVLESVQPEAAGMDPYGLKRQWGDKISFWGGLGSQSTIPFATPEEVRLEIRRLCRDMSKGGGYILAPAKPVRSETPTENAAALLEEFLDL